ncbi:MAG: hypothetical protein MJA82_04100 [Clostridia bacterium]|nr:hypothetical protein [Clostridia bacterium]
MGKKLETSMSKVGQEYNLSKSSVARYLRISKLPKEFKELVDTGQIASWTAKPASATAGKVFDMIPGMRIASTTKYKRAGFAEFNCNSYIFGITIKDNTIEVGGWF